MVLIVNDLDEFDVLYVFHDLDFLDVLYVLDVLDVLDDLDVLDLIDLAKVCSEKISLIELDCRSVKLIFHLPYIWADTLWSYKLVGWDGIGYGISVWGYFMSTVLRC